MNVNPGGMQPAMHSTAWNGHVQTMVYPDSIPKGVKAVLEERGVHTKGLKEVDMRERLKT